MCCRLLRVTLDGSSASNACKLNPSIHLGRQGSNWLPLYWSSFSSVTLDSSLITIWKTVDVCQVRFLIWFGFWSPLRGFLSNCLCIICLLGVRWCCVLAMHCRGRHGAFASREGEWDRMAEKMMLEFGESGHPVFRATSPLSRGQLKSKGGGKTVDTLLCQFGYNLNFFSHTYSCKSAQSLRSSRRNVWRIRNLSW